MRQVAAKFNAMLLLGAPGTGKGTQGKMLGTLPGVVHVAMGDIFRALDKNGELGKIFGEYSTKGLLVPDEFVVKLWKQHMDKLVADGKYGPADDLLVLDGIPRNVNQARALEQYVSVSKIVVLRCEHGIESVIQRMKARALKEGRADDANEATIRRRFEVYDAETAPVLAHYPKRLRTDVDALQTPIEVAHDILSATLGRNSELHKIEARPSVVAG
jgi:adenylate kinase